MLRIYRLPASWLLLAKIIVVAGMAACGGGDFVDEGGDCSGGKTCKAGLFCEPKTQTCQLEGGGGTPDAPPVRMDAPPDARLPDASGGATPETQILVHPTNSTGETSAAFTFSSDVATATFECSLDGGTFSNCVSPKSYTALSEGSHTFRVRAVAGGQVDPTPASYTWTIDRTGPETTITSGPTGTLQDTVAVFTFVCDQAPCTFECAMDDHVFRSCKSGDSFGNLGVGPHTFEVRASDSVGNVDPTPASATFTVSLVSLATVITTHPDPITTDANASFGFKCVENNVDVACTFVCSLDGAAATACTSPKDFTGLADGPHTVTVTGTNGGGMTDPTPAEFSWVIDHQKPITTIVMGPTGDEVVGTTTGFAYTLSEPAKSFSCTLDNAPIDCGLTGLALTGLKGGPHTFTVAGTDMAGNASDPVSAQFIVDDTGPVVVVTAPIGRGASAGVLTFTSTDLSAPVSFTCDFGTGAVACTSGFMYSGLAAGPVEITIVGTDKWGNVSTTKHTFTVATTGPSVHVFDPQDGDYACGASLSINFGADSAVAYQCKLDSNPFTSCDAPTVTYEGVTMGEHIFIVKATDSLGNEGPETTIHFTVLISPLLTALAGTPMADNSGNATVVFANDDTLMSVTAGIRLAAPNGSTQNVPGSCSCTTLRCSCHGLAAGPNTVALQAIDKCGHVGPTQTVSVTSHYGPYDGHAVVIGHDDADNDVPPSVIGNSVGLAPFIHHGLSIGRSNVRVLAWEPGGTNATSIANIQTAITETLDDYGVTFNPLDSIQYQEFSDAAQLATLLPGRDVLFVYDTNGTQSIGTLSDVAEAWSAPLTNFLNHGGIVVVMNGGAGSNQYVVLNGEVPILSITSASPQFGPSFPEVPSSTVEATNVNSTSHFFIASGLSLPGLLDNGSLYRYPLPARSNCLALSDPFASVVLEGIIQICPDNCTGFSACPQVVDKIFPPLNMTAAVTNEGPTFPGCVPPITDDTVNGTYTLTSSPTPAGIIDCFYQDDATDSNTGASPYNRESCTVFTGNSTFAFVHTFQVDSAQDRAMIELVNGNEIVRNARAPYVAEDPSSLYANAVPVAEDRCVAEYDAHVENDIVLVDPTCATTFDTYLIDNGSFATELELQTPTPISFLPLDDINCTLERYDGQSLTWTPIQTFFGIDCGAEALTIGGSSFRSTDPDSLDYTEVTVNWTTTIVDENVNGTVRMTIGARDFWGHEESATSGNWTIDVDDCGRAD